MYKKEGVRPFFGANSYIIPKINCFGTVFVNSKVKDNY